jgi:hypothetical protein
MHRSIVGREVVDDAVMIAVQQWPSDELSQSGSRSPEEMVLMHRLAWDVRRMLELLYGSDRFLSHWMIGLRFLIPQMLNVMRDWWRKRKDNRAKIIVWRRKWCNG